MGAGAGFLTFHKDLWAILCLATGIFEMLRFGHSRNKQYCYLEDWVMSRRSPELRRFLRAFFAMGLAVLMIAMTAFTAGAVPTVYDFDIDGSEHPVSTPEPVATPDISDHDIEETQNTEQIEAEEETSETDTLLADMDEAVVAFAEAGNTALQLKWEVRTSTNYEGGPVGSATVQIQGPNIGGTWGSITTVSDCVEGDCADSLDEDPRPGFFSITQRRVGAGEGFMEFRPGEIYRISAGTPSPTGYHWAPTSTIWTEMTHGAWTEGTHEYTFTNPLELIPAPSVTWQVTAGETAVGGGVVTLEGPRNGGSGSWERKVEVADCISETQCPAISMDQDPRPGYFKVFTTRLGTATGFETHAILKDRQYRIIPFNSPLGYQWNSTSPVEMTGGVSWNDANSLDFGVLPVGQSATLSWDVTDQSSNPVGGATIAVGGFAATDPKFHITDCTDDPCHPESMDQDPAPGKFKVDTLRGFSADGLTKYVESVSTSKPYKATPAGSITGHSWADKTSVTVPSGRGLDHTIGDFKVVERTTASDVCTTDNQNKYYTLSRSGNTVSLTQLEHDTGDTQISSTVTGVPGSEASLIRGDHAADALGVTPTGVFYFTGQKPLPDGNIKPSDNEAARITTIYRYDPSSNSPPYPVFDMDLLSPTTGAVVSGDATIYQGREEFYFAYYSNAPGGNGIRFHLYRYSHGSGARTGEVYHIDVPKPANFGDRFDGDFTFDKQNNLQFIISDASSNSKGAVVSGVVNAEDFQDAPSVHVLSSVTTIQGTANFGTISGGPINGVAFTAGGKGIIQQYSNSAGTTNSLVTLPGLTESTSRSWKQSKYEDLASCNTPTTITIQKNIVGARYNPEDQFTLSAYRQDGTNREDFASAATTGGESGIQRDQVGPFVLTLGGELHAKEDFPSPTIAKNYTTTWACHVRLDNGLLDDPFTEGEGTELNFSLTGEDVAPGADLVCIFTNITQQSALNVTKTVDPASGTQVDENTLLTYTLRFDNSAGTVDAAVDHTDHLQDVLDDAAFVNAEQPGTPFIAIPEGQEFTVTWMEQDTQISITGSVPSGNIWELSYEVAVKPNNASRDGTHTDFYLNSFLTPSGDAAPASCLIDDQQKPTCTTNPINAWTVSKDSRPASGARLHAGGNVHYRLAADKLTPGTMIDGLVFTDDLTNVFKTAGFAPDAAVPAGALARGIYFFDSAGYTLNGVDSPDIFASRNNQQTLQTPRPAYEESHVPVPEPVEDKWLLTSEPVAVPKNAVRAELWFAVEVGAPKEAPGSWPKVDNVVQTPKTGATFTNAVTATATAAETSTTFDPVRCATTDIEADLAGCTVTHELQDNYFTIRKDAQGPGVSAINLKSEETVADPAYGTDPTGIWNMIGHVFEIRDHDSNSNAPTAYPSLKLCRKDYDPRNASNWIDGTWIADQPAWNGEFTVSNPLDPTMFDWAEESDTLAAIQSWNSAHPDKQLPLCGLLYEQGDIDDLAQSTAGGQTGRWRSENLPQGNHWLVETKAPTHQISNDGTKKREVPGIQLLAQPIAFTIWPDTAAPEGPANHGAGQLDISPTGSFNNDWLARCSPGAEAKLRPTACVNPTGYLLLVKDITSITLPLSGGTSLAIITGTGVMILLLSGIGIFWWRRRE